MNQQQPRDISPLMRVCNRCGQMKPVSAFYAKKAHCFICSREYAKEQYHRDGERSRARARRKYHKNVALGREIGRRSYGNNIETARRVKRRCYYTDVTASREAGRKSYYKDLEKSRMRARVLAHNRVRKSNPKSKFYSAKRYALLKSGPPLTKALYEGTFELNRKQFGVLTCWVCFKEVVGERGQLEHDLSPSRGGLHTPNNLGVAHASCNRSKGRRTRAEYWTENGFPGCQK